MLFDQKEVKKVEYLELIYDLIFVYIIGRNNSLMHSVENGFVPAALFIAYALSTLAVIQIWNFSTFYINMFGRNGVRDHLFLFINMYLLYYIGEGTRLHWESFHTQYHVAWALILTNIAIQYLIEGRNHREDALITRTVRRMAGILFGESLLILLSIPTFHWGFPVFSVVAVLFGIVMTWLFAGRQNTVLVDFTHLSERAMLYVVFTFGEMIITIASYFDGELTLNSIYFSLMAFLIVVALFLSYEMLYDHIIDREKATSGMTYILLHVFLIFAMNNLTTALVFMQNPEISLMPKTLFLVSAFLLFYFCLFALMRFARQSDILCRRTILPLVLAAFLFTGAMILLREQMYLNIALSVLFVFAMFLRIYRFRKQFGS